MSFENTKAIPSEQTLELINEFKDSDSNKGKYILGLNERGESIARHVEINAFVDDFTDQSEFCGKPIVKTSDLPKDSLVVCASVMRPLTVKKKLEDQQVRQIDYFQFYLHSNLELKSVMCWDDFREDVSQNLDEYIWLKDKMADDNSRNNFEKLMSFQISGDLKYMEGFTDRQHEQYFEDFLTLQPSGETFVDVGGFHGETSIEFIKYCPEFAQIHVFEPNDFNLKMAQKSLQPHSGVFFHNLGLSNEKCELNFSHDGSSSKISSDGDIVIKVDRLDDVLPDDCKPTFIKMDIEGAEREALQGAEQTIRQHKPRLAIAVYHRGDDYRKIAKQILSYNDGYKIHFRHYTEGIVETIMFFMP